MIWKIWKIFSEDRRIAGTNSKNAVGKKGREIIQMRKRRA